MIWVGRTKDPGLISSRREPTAENAIMARTPRDLRAAMLAREGTEEGEMVCPLPCRARKAIWVPVGREQIVIGELGKPHGWRSGEVSTKVLDGIQGRTVSGLTWVLDWC